MNKKLRRQDDEQIMELEKRFDKHLEIYASNGREMARLAIAVENLSKEMGTEKIKDKEWQEIIEKKLEPLTDGAKSIKWIFGVLIAIGTLIIMFKQIFKQ